MNTSTPEMLLTQYGDALLSLLEQGATLDQACNSVADIAAEDGAGQVAGEITARILARSQAGIEPQAAIESTISELLAEFQSYVQQVTTSRLAVTTPVEPAKTHKTWRSWRRRRTKDIKISSNTIEPQPPFDLAFTHGQRRLLVEEIEGRSHRDSSAKEPSTDARDSITTLVEASELASPAGTAEVLDAVEQKSGGEQHAASDSTYDANIEDEADDGEESYSKLSEDGQATDVREDETHDSDGEATVGENAESDEAQPSALHKGAHESEPTHDAHHGGTHQRVDGRADDSETRGTDAESDTRRPDTVDETTLLKAGAYLQELATVSGSTLDELLEAAGAMASTPKSSWPGKNMMHSSHNAVEAPAWETLVHAHSRALSATAALLGPLAEIADQSPEQAGELLDNIVALLDDGINVDPQPSGKHAR